MIYISDVLWIRLLADDRDVDRMIRVTYVERADDRDDNRH
jgi:hypothetical protein